jgi:hypothetical protein
MMPTTTIEYAGREIVLEIDEEARGEYEDLLSIAVVVDGRRRWRAWFTDRSEEGST